MSLHDAEPPHASPTAPSSGRPEAAYDERVWPGPLGWFLVVGFAGLLTIALVPVDLLVAAVVGAVALAAAVTFAVVTSPRVRVRDGELTAGPARIGVGLLGPARALDRDETRAALGPGLDARAYVCLRAWAGTAVRVEVHDPADPTPYWLVSTRRPAELAAALAGAEPAGPDDARGR